MKIVNERKSIDKNLNEVRQIFKQEAWLVPWIWVVLVQHASKPSQESTYKAMMMISLSQCKFGSLISRLPDKYWAKIAAVQCRPKRMPFPRDLLFSPLSFSVVFLFFIFWSFWNLYMPPCGLALYQCGPGPGPGPALACFEIRMLFRQWFIEIA